MNVLKRLTQHEKSLWVKLNRQKPEGIWIGREYKRTSIGVKLINVIKDLGIWIIGERYLQLNWSKKEKGIQEEAEKWANKCAPDLNMQLRTL